MRVNVWHEVDDTARAQVERLIKAAEGHDGRSPISEQGLLHLLHGASTGVDHVVAVAEVAEVAERPGEVVGYAQVDSRAGGEPAAELVVLPAARERGVGGSLLDAVLARRPDVHVWSHGLLPGARELARSRGLSPARELLLMERPLGPDDDFPAAWPPGYTVAMYRPGDAPEWVRVNAAAFTAHAEQGRMTLADLRDRTRQNWFDPAGFFLVRDPRGALAAFHWTKVEAGVGEVYVVGVAPSQQRLGLGKAVTAIGLRHLRDLGLPLVRLYVDGDNVAAIATYLKSGFTEVSRDVQFARSMTR